MKSSDKKSMHSSAIQRRKTAIERLLAQLERGTKPNKNGTTAEKAENAMIPLTDKDKQRIEKEIETLKTRI